MAETQHSILGQCLADQSQRVMDIDDVYLEIIGRDRHEVIGVHALSFTHAADLARNRPLLNGLSGGESPFAITKRYIRPSGELIWVKNHVSAFRDGSKLPLLSATCELLSDSDAAATLAGNLRLARTVRDALRLGSEIFDHAVGAPPAEVLLLLYIAELEGAALTLEALSEGVRLKSQLVRRWLVLLNERGLTEGLFDDGSADRSTVRISRKGELTLEKLLAHIRTRLILE